MHKRRLTAAVRAGAQVRLQAARDVRRRLDLECTMHSVALLLRLVVRCPRQRRRLLVGHLLLDRRAVHRLVAALGRLAVLRRRAVDRPVERVAPQEQDGEEADGIERRADDPDGRDGAREGVQDLLLQLGRLDLRELAEVGAEQRGRRGGVDRVAEAGQAGQAVAQL